MQLWFGSRKPPEERPRKCSFCAKSVDDVLVLITGQDVAICDECVGTCTETLWEWALKSRQQAGSEEQQVRASCRACSAYHPVSKIVHIPTGSNLCRDCASALAPDAGNHS